MPELLELEAQSVCLCHFQPEFYQASKNYILMANPKRGKCKAGGGDLICSNVLISIPLYCFKIQYIF